MTRPFHVFLLVFGVAIGCATTALAPRASLAEVSPVSPHAVEYRLFEVAWGFGLDEEKMVEELNELGRQGWKIVSPLTVNGGTSHFVLMRSKHE